MRTQSFHFRASDGKEIFTHQWLPETDTPIKAILQISHGMAEHAGRYEPFAKALTARQFAVYANDHRGHRHSAILPEEQGYFADKEGWQLVVGDLKSLTDIIREKHPGLPVFLLGHSMGSLLSRSYVFSHGQYLQGLILSATAGDPGLLGRLGIVVARIEVLLRGKKAKSPLLDKLSFGKFNDAFKPNRTPFDWLSREECEVDKYIADPHCGLIFTTGFFRDLLRGIKSINAPSNISKVPKNLPIYLISGSKDPVGGDTKGVQQVIQQYDKAGITDLSHRFYEEGRHEILNEINKEEVYEDIIGWKEARL